MTMVQKSGIFPPNHKMPFPFHSFQSVSHLRWSALPTFLTKLHKSWTEFIFCYRVIEIILPNSHYSQWLMFFEHSLSDFRQRNPDTVNVSVLRCPSFVNDTFLNVWGTIISSRTYSPLSTLLCRVKVMWLENKSVSMYPSLLIIISLNIYYRRDYKKKLNFKLFQTFVINNIY